MRIRVEPVETDRGLRYELRHEGDETWYVGTLVDEDEAALLSSAPELADALASYQELVRLLPSGVVPQELVGKLAEAEREAEAALRKAGRI